MFALRIRLGQERSRGHRSARLLGGMSPSFEVRTQLTQIQMSGFWTVIFLGRWSMVLGWRDLFRSKILQRRHEFVSVDARRLSNDPRTYEMLDTAKTVPALNISTPDRVLSPGQAHPLRSSPMTPEPDARHQDYFISKNTIGAADNLSPETPAPAYTYSPNSPSMFSPREWDHRATQARPNYPPGIAISKDYT